WQQDYTTPWTF
nr:immunoglobulin light chain junction region [Macaca mulatta]MPN90638.1 immunoglobulin light chain junction region [Macaca mulatta]